MLQRSWSKLLTFSWISALLSLPLTSFPPLVRLTGALVAPLAALPIFFLLAVWLLPHLLKGGDLPKETSPLLLFILAALIACAAAFFLEIPPFKDHTIFSREVRALFTLVIGLAFYLVFAGWNRDQESLRVTWRWLNIGGMLMLGWALLQAFFILRVQTLPGWLETLQEIFLVKMPNAHSRGLRVDAWAYEPSWFAHQMVMLYFPLWLSASYLRTSAFKRGILRLSVENGLLLLGLLTFFLARPRVSMISLLLMLIFLFLKLNLYLYRRAIGIILTQPWAQHRARAQAAIRRATAIGTALGMAGMYVAMLAGAVYLASKLDWRVRLLLESPPSWAEISSVLMLNENALLLLAFRLAFLERVVYWIAGWNVFRLFPWLGVGLGNAGFFFPITLPAIGYASWEVRDLLFYLPNLPNIKSMWVRLLAETGLVGFAAFLGWLYLSLHSAWVSHRSQDPAVRTLALSGLLGLIAFLGEGFSIDSFAMPYLWVAAGLVAAAGRAFRQERRQLALLEEKE